METIKFSKKETEKEKEEIENAPEKTPSQQPQEIVGRSPSMQEFDTLRNIMYAILVVVALGFIGFLFQSFWASATAFEDLKDQVITQNAKIDALTAQLEVYSNGKIK